MICEVQSPGTANMVEVPLLQVMAETPTVNDVTGGGVRKIKVVACRVPVEPKSTSASPPPKTSRRPGSWSAESTTQRKVGDYPKGPDHRLGSNFSHDSAVMAMVQFGWMEIAGSLSPSASSNGVLEKVTAPFTVPPSGSALTNVVGGRTRLRCEANDSPLALAVRGSFRNALDGLPTVTSLSPAATNAIAAAPERSAVAVVALIKAKKRVLREGRGFFIFSMNFRWQNAV